ncbi:hypothetical protein [Arthrobacter sp. LFS091]|uniref:hypothetical protein n=1 Tax=Arthrobacter sp. LFS091 TaxID=3229892 RepID=UPI003A80F5F1
MPAAINYSGTSIELPEGIKVDELANVLQNIQNSGEYRYFVLDLPGVVPKRIRLMFGPGIPYALVSDPLDGHEAELSDDDLAQFMTGSGS